MTLRAAVALALPLLASAGHELSVFDQLFPGAKADEFPPKGVHIGYGLDPTEMRVSWATYKSVTPSGALGMGVYGGVCPAAGCGGSHAEWGLTATALTEKSAAGAATVQTYDANRTWYQHTISLTGLKPSTKYFYRVGDPATGWSRVFSFTSEYDASTLAANLPQARTQEIPSTTGLLNGLFDKIVCVYTDPPSLRRPRVQVRLLYGPELQLLDDLRLRAIQRVARHHF